MRVVVTGASGDVGSGIVSALRCAGHKAIQAHSSNCDVRDTDDVSRFLAEHWPFDGLVTCHGAPGCVKPSLELTDEEWSGIIDVDLTGTFRVCREAARYMLGAAHGSIVNVSSIHALATYPQRAAYAAVKAGVVGLTRALAIEWGGRGVRVNAVMPGQVGGTRRTKPVLSEELLSRSPTGSLVTPNQVGSAVLHLLTNEGINGTTLVVDDGWLASAYWGPHGE